MTRNYSRKCRPREPLGPRQRRELARLLALLAATPPHQEKPAGRLSRALDWASGHFNLLAAAAVLLAFLGAWIKFDVSPLRPLEKIHNEQEEYKRQEDKRNFIKTVVERRLKMGRKLLNESFYEDAKKEFTKALDLDNESLPAELGILKCEVYELGAYNPALIEKRVEVINEYCIKLNKPNAPKDPHVLVFLGDIHYREGDIDNAIKDFQTAVEIDDDVAGAHFKLGYLYENKSEQALALHDTRSAKALKALALEEYKKAVEKSKWNPIYCLNLASQYARMNEPEKAIVNYKRAIRLAPDFILPYLELSNVFRQNGKLLDAHKCLHEAVIRLEDQRVAASPQNQGGWVFDGDFGQVKVNLYAVPEKQAYAYLSMALTLYLLDKKPEALCYLKKARSVKLKTMPRVLSVVCQDHARLPDPSKKKSNFLAILKREIPTSE